MKRDDRTVDRKADPNAGDAPDEAVTPPDDPQPTARDRLAAVRSKLPDAPDAPATTLSYVAIVSGALAVAYAATSLAAVYGGTRFGILAAGVFAFAYGYAVLTAITQVQT